jgi:hypothetical protein
MLRGNHIDETKTVFGEFVLDLLILFCTSNYMG